MATKFWHYRKPFRVPGIKETYKGATFAWVVKPDGRVEYSVAFCSERDQFNRKIGRAIAEGRLKMRNPNRVRKWQGISIKSTNENYKLPSANDVIKHFIQVWIIPE